MTGFPTAAAHGRRAGDKFSVPMDTDTRSVGKTLVLGVQIASSYRRPNLPRRTVIVAVESRCSPWSARPSHVCWLTWSSWAQACSGGPSWRPTSKRFRVRTGSLHLSCRRLLSAALLAVHRRWQGECCHEAGDGEGRYDGGRGAGHPEREAEGPRRRGSGGADAHRLGLLGFELLHCHAPQMAAVAASARDTLLVACRPCCGVAPPRPRIPRGRTRAWQAADRLLGLNSKDKGGSAYLCAKVTNARNTLLGEPVPHHVETKACMAGQGSQSRPSG